MDTIKLNDILRLDYLNKLMIRFNLTCGKKIGTRLKCACTLSIEIYQNLRIKKEIAVTYEKKEK